MSSLDSSPSTTVLCGVSLKKVRGVATRCVHRWLDRSCPRDSSSHEIYLVRRPRWRRQQTKQKQGGTSSCDSIPEAITNNLEQLTKRSLSFGVRTWGAVVPILRNQTDKIVTYRCNNCQQCKIPAKLFKVFAVFPVRPWRKGVNFTDSAVRSCASMTALLLVTVRAAM